MLDTQPGFIFSFIFSNSGVDVSGMSILPSISSTFYERVFHTKFWRQSQNVTRKNDVRTKKAREKMLIKLTPIVQVLRWREQNFFLFSIFKIEVGKIPFQKLQICLLFLQCFLSIAQMKPLLL